MPFEAIVHAPALRIGARLNIAEADQIEGARPSRLCVGAELRLRLGCCSPGHARGRIVGYSAAPESVVLAVGAETWTLRPAGTAGVSVPGLISETWFVVGRGDVPASPSDHSPDHSTAALAAEG